MVRLLKMIDYFRVTIHNLKDFRAYLCHQVVHGAGAEPDPYQLDGKLVVIESGSSQVSDVSSTNTIASASIAHRMVPVSRNGVLPGIQAGLVLAAVMALGACSTKPPQQEPGAKEIASQVEPLSEFMSRAQAAEAAEGGRERARLIYRDAAKSYPTDKRPWLRLAQSYFDASDYGNAVLAAQEVVQRDPADNVAQGLLAVSGLRISTAALSTLRNQNNLSTSARSEAEDMARNLRTILGESVLVPKPSETAVDGGAPRAAPRAAPRPPARPRAARPAPSSAPAATTAPPVVPPPQPSSNPFGALK